MLKRNQGAATSHLALHACKVAFSASSPGHRVQRVELGQNAVSGEGRPMFASERASYSVFLGMAVTMAACGPLDPSTMSNSTSWPSTRAW
jgi:hypothetical protein